MRYYMFHKPAGCVTARTDGTHKTVMDYFPEEDRHILFPVGRLDLDTEGLLLVTDDGHFDQAMIHPRSHTRKTYFFYAKGAPTIQQIELLQQGVLLEGQTKRTLPAELKVLEQGTYRDFKDRVQIPNYSRENDISLAKPVFAGTLTICEGRKHEVKRLLLSIGCRIVYLKRIAIGELKLDSDLDKGEFRQLSTKDLEILHYQPLLPEETTNLNLRIES